MTIFDKLLKVNQSNFFELDINTFANLQEVLSPKLYKKFTQTNEAYWLADTYFMEVSASIMYQHLANQIKDSGEFSPEDTSYMFQYLLEISQEEQTHADMLKQIICDIIGEDIQEHYTDPDTISLVLARNKDKTIQQIIVEYYVGESSLLSVYHILYKHTTNIEKKKVLQQLMIDESKHQQLALTIIDKSVSKLTSNQKEQLLDWFLEQSSSVARYQIEFFRRYFRITSNNKLKQELVNKAYSGDFEEIYRASVNSKLFKYIERSDHKIDFQTFVTLVDTRIASMLYL
jgi:rubrerythrin